MLHHQDRTLYELEDEADEAEGGMYESEELELELELAGELLELTSEQELDRFLGNLLKTAASAGKAFLGSDAGKAVGGLLKGAAKQVLPQAGRVLGDLVVPGAGGEFGSKLASSVGAKLGLELEGLSAEDRELEAARAFVRFADETAKIAEAAPASVPPAAAAAHAAAVAAQRHLPGIAAVVRELRPPGPGGPNRPVPNKVGRWVRHGQTIVVHDVYDRDR
jgi:hypothetical protein